MLEIKCFDSPNGNQIESYTQWDINQVLYIENWNYDLTPIFHFCNVKSNEALVVKGEIVEGGFAKADVPNILLQQHFPLVVFVYLEDDESGKSIYMSQIPIKKRPKPEDYEYVENIEYVSWIRLEKEARYRIEQLIVKGLRAINSLVSPTIEVEQKDGITKLIITDVNGKQTLSISGDVTIEVTKESASV